ncbi:MAG: hypothetical protein JSS96_08950 [Bacteroidetes bacterium]|nr:hypothetical protein [Bacteroidota bacterium]
MQLNEVFNTIKKYCSGVSSNAGSEAIEGIKDELHIANNPLEVYLQILKNMNLIDFSLNERGFISLTDLGKRVEDVPDSMPSIIL